MPFNIPHNSTPFAIVIVTFVCSPLCIIATVLHFLSSRLSLHRTVLDDWFALAALICYLCFAILIVTSKSKR